MVEKRENFSQISHENLLACVPFFLPHPHVTWRQPVPFFPWEEEWKGKVRVFLSIFSHFSSPFHRSPICLPELSVVSSRIAAGFSCRGEGQALSWEWKMCLHFGKGRGSESPNNLHTVNPSQYHTPEVFHHHHQPKQSKAAQAEPVSHLPVMVATIFSFYCCWCWLPQERGGESSKRTTS